MAAHQAPPSLGFSRQEHWSGLPFPSPVHGSKKRKWSGSFSFCLQCFPASGSSLVNWLCITWPECWSSSTLEILFSSVQSLSRVQLFETPWTAVHQASLFTTNSWSLFKLMSIESVMPSNHLILCDPVPLAFSLSQHQGLFKWVTSSRQVAKGLEFQLQHQSFQWTPRTDLL